MPLSTRYGFADAPTSAIIGDGSLGWTTSTGTLAAAGTSLTVASSSAFPASLEFDIVIGVRNATTGVWATAETRHVTVVSGTTWTVAAGSLSHVSGSDIAYVMTATALKHSPGAMTDTGDMPYLLATGRMGRLEAPANGAYAVTWASGVPSWTAASSGIGYADLATPPNDTALGSSGTPFGQTWINNTLTASGRLILGPGGFDSVLYAPNTLVVSGSAAAAEADFIVFYEEFDVSASVDTNAGTIYGRSCSMYATGSHNLHRLTNTAIFSDLTISAGVVTEVNELEIQQNYFSASGSVTTANAIKISPAMSMPVTNLRAVHMVAPNLSGTPVTNYAALSGDDQSSLSGLTLNYFINYAGKFTVSASGAVLSLGTVKAAGYLSSDGTAGTTGGPWTSVTVKNGLVVSGS